MSLSITASVIMATTLGYPYFVFHPALAGVITIAHIAAIIIDITNAVFCGRIVGCCCCGGGNRSELILVMDNLTVQQGKVKGQWV